MVSLLGIRNFERFSYTPRFLNGLKSLSRWQVYHGTMSAAKGILREKGIRGLYSGLNITLLEILPHSAIQFGTYDFLTHTYEEYRSKAFNKVSYQTP